MAERRLFSTKITQSDMFLDMPLEAQALYIHLCMNADDDGVVDSPKRIVRMVNARQKDLNLLEEKRFLLRLNESIVLIKHWLVHNSINKQRYRPTKYADLMDGIYLKEDGVYTDRAENGLNKWHPYGQQCSNNVQTMFQQCRTQVKSSQYKDNKKILSSSSSISPSPSYGTITDRLTEDEYKALEAAIVEGEMVGLLDKLEQVDAGTIDKPYKYCMAVARDMGIVKGVMR